MYQLSLAIFILIASVYSYSNTGDNSAIVYSPYNDTIFVKGKLIYFADSSIIPGVRIFVNNSAEYHSNMEGRFEIPVTHTYIDSIRFETIGCRPITFTNIPGEKEIDLDSIMLFDIEESIYVIYAEVRWYQFLRKAKVKKAALKERNDLHEKVEKGLANYRYKFNGQFYAIDKENNSIDLMKPLEF